MSEMHKATLAEANEAMSKGDFVLPIDPGLAPAFRPGGTAQSRAEPASPEAPGHAR